ncbi:MAG: hypothetical protein VX026_14135, partial [Myxococcota bacterium]|nr:hypothetical protein [Myxococcota bacterium]
YRDNLRNGESYIYLGANLTPNSGIYTHSEADRAILGQLYRFMLKPTGAGDINGDGLDDLFLRESVDGMGFHIYLTETVMNASSELYLEDADVTFRGGETSPDSPFMTSLGDLDADGLDEIIMGWTGDYNGVYNQNYASLFWGSTVMAALNDSVDDSGLPLDEPVLFDVTDADFVFPDVKDASKLGDIDLDGLGEFILSNNSYSFAEAGGGVNGIFSACEN